MTVPNALQHRLGQHAPYPLATIQAPARWQTVLYAVLVGLAAHGCAAEPANPGSVAPVDAASGDASGQETATADGGTDGTGGVEAGTVDAADGTGSTDAADSVATADSADAAEVAAQVDASNDAAGDADAGATCQPTVPSTEACDGIDNDCDGKTDQPADGAKPLCDDGDACTTDACDGPAGKCAAPKAIACDDGNPCTDDACAKATGCTAAAKTGACDDGDACTDASACDGGVCKGGEAKGCDDGNVCTADTCSPQTGCASVPCAGAGAGCGKGNCSDGDACTQGDLCADGLCKAGTAKCNDANACTTDACDAATGTCSVAPIAGCKVCKLAADCDDKNPCTTDLCTNLVCVTTPVKGCIGPPDYKAIALVPDKNTFPVPGQMTGWFTMRNDGKPFGFLPQNQKLKWEMWLSVDASIGEGDFLAGPATVIDGYNIGDTGQPSPQLEKKVQIYFSVAKESEVPVGAKFLCGRIVGAVDADQTNNTVCVAMPTPKYAEYKMVSLSLNDKNAVVGDPGTVSVGYAHQDGPADIQVPFALFASVDAAWDAADTALGTTLLSPLNAGTSKTIGIASYWPTSIKLEHKFVCGVVNLAGLGKEPTPADNALCVPMTVVPSLPDLGVVANSVGFVTAAGVAVSNPTWGVAYGCNAASIANSGFAPADDFLMRCWLSPTGAGPEGTAWSLAWQNQTAIPAASLTGVWPKAPTVVPGATANVASTTQAALNTAAFGDHMLCMDLNVDAKMPEKVVSPKVCRKIHVYGVDVRNLGPAFGTVFPNNLTEPIPLQVLSRGTPYPLRWYIHNMGNATLADPKKLVGRALLSKDGTPSADDHVIWTGNLPTIYNNVTAYGGIQNGLMLTMDVKFTLPLTLAAGSYNVLYDLNYTKAIIEPEVGNLSATQVTLK